MLAHTYVCICGCVRTIDTTVLICCFLYTRSVHSTESDGSGLRRRHIDRQDSKQSIVSGSSKTKLQIEDQGKLIETEKSRTGGVSLIFLGH